MMQKLTLGLLFSLGFANTFATAASISTSVNAPILVAPATIHQLFKSCKKSGAYGCELKGKTITAGFKKSKSSAAAPTMIEDNLYLVYWWPNHCTPPAEVKNINSCEFNLLLEAKA
jgi:hypothetical protein